MEKKTYIHTNDEKDEIANVFPRTPCRRYLTTISKSFGFFFFFMLYMMLFVTGAAPEPER